MIKFIYFVFFHKKLPEDLCQKWGIHGSAQLKFSSWKKKKKSFFLEGLQLKIK